MNDHFKNIILNSTQANDCAKAEKIQDLWSGYGTIVRYKLKGAPMPSVIVKHISLPKGSSHSRGWNTNLSHTRKLKSYRVESAWYSQWSKECDDNCYVPKCFACETHEDETLIVLEDLDASGFAERRQSVSLSEIKTTLSWLAHFHATFLGQAPENLWSTGTYWHLKTRPDELKALNDKPLKAAARAIDQKLRRAEHQTFVHGDAKLANFCFAKGGTRVAAVDFQYVGGGCGMKDVAYFIGSCLHEAECEQFENQLLEHYFQTLRTSINTRQKGIDLNSLESEWRSLYPVAWSDFHRFIKGWSPGHWKINDYSELMVQKTLKIL